MLIRNAIRPLCSSYSHPAAPELLHHPKQSAPKTGLIYIYKGHILRSTFNENTIKVSYRTLGNLGQTINRHYAKILRNNDTNNVLEGCNCQKKENCPLEGNCKIEKVVYGAAVETNDHRSEPYTGLTINTFKERYTQHSASMRRREGSSSTTLSEYFWKAKDEGKEPTVTWSILGRGGGYNPKTKSCGICLLEKYIIMFE